jgi:hypothetical protein
MQQIHDICCTGVAMRLVWHDLSMDASPQQPPSSQPFPSRTDRLEATLTGRFPPPDAALDPYLDAFERAAVRFGVRRVTGTDVAREAGVDRTTVFRNVGTMDDLHREYVTREVHRFISGVVSQIPEGLDGPSTVVEIVAVAIEAATQHPVLSKVLNDEQDYLGQLIPPFLPMILEQVSAALAVAPPEEPLRELLGEVLIPLLEPRSA